MLLQELDIFYIDYNNHCPSILSDVFHNYVPVIAQKITLYIRCGKQDFSLLNNLFNKIVTAVIFNYYVLQYNYRSCN